MKVIRCPSCSARYNADRLPSGAVFDCNRCGATVTVPSGAPASVSLVIGGLLVLGALFCWSAPSMEAALVLPWEEFLGTAECDPRAGMVLWALLGLWALLTALVPGFASRSTVTLGLGGLALVLAAAATGGGFPILAPRLLPWLVGTIALGAGAVLMVRGIRGTATTALLAGGGLLLLGWYALAFLGEEPSGLELIVADVRALLAGSLEDDKGTVSYLAGTLGQHGAVLLAALGGLIAALGLRAHGFGLLLVVLLAYAFLVPGAMRLGEFFQDGFQWASLGTDGLRILGRVLVADGVALWALLVWAAADLGAAREVTS